MSNSPMMASIFQSLGTGPFRMVSATLYWDWQVALHDPAASKYPQKEKIRGNHRDFTIVLLCVIGCAVYVNDYYHAEETAVQAMAADDHVTVRTAEDGTLLFLPDDPQTGLIFYPGGKVEHTAYAPLMRACAERGILCVLLKMPWNLAVLDMNAADGIAEQFPDIDAWYIGGHSLGGAMAANYAAGHSGEFEGLILLAAYSTKDLSGSDLAVLSIYGSEDDVLNMEKNEANRDHLPADAIEVVIEGGCHAGFGAYGPQDGDGTPSISGKEQIERTAAEIQDLMKEVSQ